MKKRLAVVCGLLVLLATDAVSGFGPQDAEPFPHRKHARVFPVCDGCHAGILSGVASEIFPSVEDCQRCHDGNREKTVAWRPRATDRLSNLRFSHTSHRDVSAGDSTTCLTCHASTTPPQRMGVAGPDPERCIGCHAHRNDSHLSPTARCRTCHAPVADATSLSRDRIARFPTPSWHNAPGFTFDHGRVDSQQGASCAVCHARESCERCHANADRVPLIASLPRDGRVAALALGKDAEYPTPGSHDTDWRVSHGAAAMKSGATCANCHTQPSCETCHADGSGTSRVAIRSLPGREARAGLGVPTSRISRAVHPPDIRQRHGTLAASSGMDCAQCHAESACASCHAANDSRRFHADNFVERHAVDVFSGSADCQSCHNTERFCRDCHARTGIAAEARMSAAFHTGKANWVLSHGQAARTGMESCASCHRQSDCVRCHSATGGWGVNPHRAGFTSGGLSERNSASCRWCHIGRLPGGGP